MLRVDQMILKSPLAIKIMPFSTLGESKIEQKQIQIRLGLSMLLSPCVHIDDQELTENKFSFYDILDHHCDYKIQSYFMKEFLSVDKYMQIYA